MEAIEEGGSNSSGSGGGSSGHSSKGQSGSGGILPRPACGNIVDPRQWAWERRGGMRSGFFPHGPMPHGHPFMRPGFFRPHRVYPIPPHHFAHRKGVPGVGPGPPGWSGLAPPPRMMPLPYMPPPLGVVPPVPQPSPADAFHMVTSASSLAWSASNPVPTSTTEDDLPSGEKKKKKKIVNGNTRPWNREAAEKALEVELECQKNVGANAIVIRFPDPDLSKEIVQGFNKSIENVHFQSPCGPRYCFVMVNKKADVDEVIADLNKIKYGVGHLKAERKVPKNDEPVSPESIDPFTLYVGNLPTNISTVEVKEKFPTATRIDIGYAQKLKYTRYAFVRYAAASEALEAFKASVNTVIASRSIILRFRRHKGPVGPKGEKPCPPEIEAKPGEKLTVGAKLKAKREKQKAEKDKKEKIGKPKKKKIKLDKSKEEDASSTEDELELENDDDDDDDSPEEEVEDDDDDDDSDDSDEEGDDDDDDDDDDMVDDTGNDDDDDDDIDDDEGPDDDDMYDDGPDDEEYLSKNDFGNTSIDWNGFFDF